MRGDPFHNQLADTVRTFLERRGWRVWTEKRVVAADTIAYFDLFAVKDGQGIAFEIETTARHALDNAKKARALGVPVWFVVPRRRTKRQILRKLGARFVAGGESVEVLLIDEIEGELAHRRTSQTTKDEYL